MGCRNWNRLDGRNATHRKADFNILSARQFKGFPRELVDMGYLTLEHPRKKQNGRRVPDEQSLKVITLSQVSFLLNLSKIL